MLKSNELVSECCGGEPYLSLDHSLGEDPWGRCSDCNQWSMFEDRTEWDEDYIAELPSNNTGPTGQPVTIPQSYSDKDRLAEIAKNNSIDFPEKFDPKIISWVTDRIAITSRQGVAQALSDGHFVINTAEEINNDAHVKKAVKPGSGTVLHVLNAILNVIDNVLYTTNQKVVVHCAMGMERSVLSVVWYLANTNGMTLESALNLVQSKRPIAMNRLNWIAG